MNIAPHAPHTDDMHAYHDSLMAMLVSEGLTNALLNQLSAYEALFFRMNE